MAKNQKYLWLNLYFLCLHKYKIVIYKAWTCQQSCPDWESPFLRKFESSIRLSPEYQTRFLIENGTFCLFDLIECLQGMGFQEDFRVQNLPRPINIIYIKPAFETLRTHFRHLYVLILIQLYLERDVKTGIATFPTCRMFRWKIDWVLPHIISVPLLTRETRVLSATRPILIHDGNIAIVSFAIELKVGANVCHGMHHLMLIISVNWKAMVHYIACRQNQALIKKNVIHIVWIFHTNREFSQSAIELKVAGPVKDGIEINLTPRTSSRSLMHTTFVPNHMAIINIGAIRLIQM